MSIGRYSLPESKRQTYIQDLCDLRGRSIYRPSFVFKSRSFFFLRLFILPRLRIVLFL